MSKLLKQTKWLLLSLGGTMLVLDAVNVYAVEKFSAPDRGFAQTIQIVVEVAALVVMLGLGVLAWQLAKRDGKAKKAREQNKKAD